VTKGSATGAAEPAVGWYAAGSQLILAASPSGNYLFESWTGNGTGAYSGTEVSTLVTVNAPINELALFELPPPPIQTKGGFYAQTSTWGIFAVVGLVVGIALGMVLTMMSRRRRQAPPPPEAEEPAPVSENEVVEEPAVPWTEPEEPEGSGSEQ